MAGNYSSLGNGGWKMVVISKFCNVNETKSTQPFFLIVIDDDRGVFSVEGPMIAMTDPGSSPNARHARSVALFCGPSGADQWVACGTSSSQGP